MGTIYHEAMIVTSWDTKAIEGARSIALEIFDARFVSEILPVAINRYQSFLIGSSGSKLGWEDYETHQKNMRDFAARLKIFEYEDCSSSISTVAVRYGADLEGSPHVLDLSPAPPQKGEG